MKRFVWVLALGLVLTGGAFAAYLWQAHRAAEAALPVNTRLGGEFVLPSTLGQPYDLKARKGRVVLLSFGYTACPDVCPTLLARMKQVLKGLGDQAGQMDAVFVSFDPQRDSMDHLKQYVEYFDPRIIGATGPDVSSVAASFGVIAMRQDRTDGKGYDFAHSDYIYLLDQQGRVRKLYDNEATTREMQQDIATLMQEGHGPAWL